MATATIQYRVNAGALHTDSIEVSGGDVVSLTAASFAGWATPAARWEIVAYPPDWPQPSGWSTDASTGYYYYLANSGGSGVTPPSITIPATSSYWGKWLFRLTVNGTIVSATIGVETLSPVLELHDLAASEGAQFGLKRNWPGPHQENLRTVDASALVGGGFVASITSAGSPLTITPTTGAAIASWNPTADLSLASHKITNVTDPSSAQDVATKAYVDSVAAGLDPKESVYLAGTVGDGNITLSGSQSIDGVASGTTGKRILLKEQTDPIENGIWTTAAGAWARATDLDTGASAAGAYCFVEAGATLADKGFVCTSNDGSDIVGTDGLAWTQFSGGLGASSTANYVTDSASAVNVNDRPAQALPATLDFIRAGGAAISAAHTAAAGSVTSAIKVRRTITGGTSGSAGTGSAVEWFIPDGNVSPVELTAGRIRFQWVSVLAGAVTSKMVISTVASGPTETDALTLTQTGVCQTAGGFDAMSATTLLLGPATATGVSINSTTGAITYKKGNVSARVDTFEPTGASTGVWAAGVTSIAESITQHGSAAGVTWTRTGQQGAVGFAGGDLAFAAGDGGDPGTDAPGNIRLVLGTPVAQTSGEVRIETAAGGAILDIGTIGGPTVNIHSGAYATAGLELRAVAGYATMRAAAQATVQSDAGSIRMNASSGVTDFYVAGFVSAAVLTVAPTGAQSLTMTVRAGSGANNGNTFDFTAQPGQAQTGGAANNNGGALRLNSGAAGTGGGGAAGVDGDLTLRTGTTSRIAILGSGASITHTATTHDFVGVATITKSGITTSLVAGETLATEASTSGVTVRHSPATVWASRAWVSGADSTKRGAFEVVPTTNASSCALVWYYDTGGGTFSEAFRFDAFDATFFDTRLRCSGFCITQGTQGIRFTSGSGMLQDGSSNAEFRSVGTGAMLLNNSGKTTGGTGSACTVEATSGTHTAGYLLDCVNNATRKWDVRFDGSTDSPRHIAAPSTPTSASNAVTFDFQTSQNVKHATTENTTVTFSNAVEGMDGTIEFIQGVSGKTITMPTNGTGVEYDNAIAALTTTGIVDTTASTRTVLRYYVTGSPNVRVYIYARSVSTIP